MGDGTCADVSQSLLERVSWSAWSLGWVGKLGASTAGNGGVQGRRACTSRTFGP